jgi:ribulose-5-phosphate 4-epimerase/fuculose-1-phosphate aldolase
MNRADIRQIVSEQEWKLRCDLAALYRLLAFHRMTDLIFTHISMKLPGEDDSFLINPYGMAFGEIKASDLMKVDKDGNLIDDGVESPYGINKAGFVIHSAIHCHRPDVLCVVHTHTAAGVAVSAQKRGLLPLSQHALKFQGHLAYHSYEGIALDETEQASLIADLGPHRAMILRNHGLLVCGRTAAEAFDHIYFLERACEIQVKAGALGYDEIDLPSVQAQQKAARQWRMHEPEVRDFCELAWQAALREAGIAASSAYS